MYVGTSADDTKGLINSDFKEFVDQIASSVGLLFCIWTIRCNAAAHQTLHQMWAF